MINISEMSYLGESDPDDYESPWICIQYYFNGNGSYQCIGYISSKYPAALLKSNCPDEFRESLESKNILCADLKEPMYCDEEILKKIADHKVVFDDNFIDDDDCDVESEKFKLFLDKFVDGNNSHVNSSGFYIDEIRRQ